MHVSLRWEGVREEDVKEDVRHQLTANETKILTRFLRYFSDSYCTAKGLAGCTRGVWELIRDTQLQLPSAPIYRALCRNYRAQPGSVSFSLISMLGFHWDKSWTRHVWENVRLMKPCRCGEVLDFKSWTILEMRICESASDSVLVVASMNCLQIYAWFIVYEQVCMFYCQITTTAWILGFTCCRLHFETAVTLVECESFEDPTYTANNHFLLSRSTFSPTRHWYNIAYLMEEVILM